MRIRRVRRFLWTALAGGVFLTGCGGAGGPESPVAVIRLRPADAEIREERLHSPALERNHARFSIRMWRLREASRRDWAGALKANLWAGKEAESFAAGGIAVAKATEPLIEKLRRAKAIPGWYARANVCEGRRADLVLGPRQPPKPEPTKAEPKGKAPETDVVIEVLVKNVRTDGVEAVLRPILRKARGRTPAGAASFSCRLRTGEGLLLMRHPEAGPGLGDAFRVTETRRTEETGPDDRKETITREELQERCVILTFDGLGAATVPAAESKAR